MIEKIKLYLRLLRKRDWREINYRLQLLFQRIDLKNVPVDELNLSAERAYDYADSGGAAFEKVLDSLLITPSDTIVDFGCGKGGALITLAKYPFSQITGVEISSRLVDIAQKNLRKLWIDNVSIELCDATEFVELDDYNYFYFFNPFPCPIMRTVMENIEKSVAVRPRNVTIIYLNPECHDAVVKNTSFVKQQEFDHPTLRYYIYSNEMHTNK